MTSISQRGALRIRFSLLQVTLSVPRAPLRGRLRTPSGRKLTISMGSWGQKRGNAVFFSSLVTLFSPHQGRYHLIIPRAKMSVILALPSEKVVNVVMVEKIVNILISCLSHTSPPVMKREISRHVFQVRDTFPFVFFFFSLDGAWTYLTWPCPSHSMLPGCDWNLHHSWPTLPETQSFLNPTHSIGEC